MSNHAYLPEVLANAEHSVGLFDDFFWFVTAHQWTSTLSDSGTAAVVAGTTNLRLECSDGTVADNDEAYVATTNALFPMAANRNLYGEARIQYTESGANIANVAFGFASSVAADLIVDNGGGMRASGGVLAIYKIDGGTNWICVSRNGTTVFTNTSSTPANTGLTQTLGIEVVELLSTTATVVFKVDGVVLRDSTTGQPIRHQLPYSGMANLQLFAGAKNGGGTMETLNIDYLAAVQAR